MTEKKTFKINGPNGMGLGHNALLRVWEVFGVQPELEEGINRFDPLEWDMEVTFTKEARPEVGGTATLENYTTVFTIIAVSDGRVWLQDPGNQAQNFVRRFDQLRNVEPWQPA